MSFIADYPHLSIGADGKARIAETRHKVIHLAAEHYHYGWSAEELLRQHPDLRPEEVYAALTYFYDHLGEMVAEMTSATERVDTQRDQQSLSRVELLRRGQETP